MKWNVLNIEFIKYEIWIQNMHTVDMLFIEYEILNKKMQSENNMKCESVDMIRYHTIDFHVYKVTITNCVILSYV